MIRYVAAVAVLTAIYALALTDFSLWNLAAGVIISSALLFSVRRRFGRSLTPSGDVEDLERGSLGVVARRVVAFFPFAAAVVKETLVGAWRVLLAVLGVRPPKEPGLVAVPLDDRTAEGIAVTAFLAAFSPGTLLVRVDEAERVMWIHAMDAAEPETVRRGQKEFYERYQRKVFP